MRFVRGLLWVVVLFLGLPLSLRFGVYALYLVLNGLDGAGITACLAVVDLLPLGVCTALTAMSHQRMMSHYVPAWLWVAVPSVLALLWAVDIPSEPLFGALPLLVSVLLLALNGLWSLSARVLWRKDN